MSDVIAHPGPTKVRVQMPPVKSMNCSICTKPIPPRHEITCPDCWFKIPGNERHALARMHREKNTSGLNAKLAKLKRLIEAKINK